MLRNVESLSEKSELDCEWYMLWVEVVSAANFIKIINFCLECHKSVEIMQTDECPLPNHHFKSIYQSKKFLNIQPKQIKYNHCLGDQWMWNFGTQLNVSV